MSRTDKLVRRVLLGKSLANIDFDDVRLLLLQLGFDETIRGSHHLFRRPDIVERINLQRDGRTAKVYQIRQVRRVLLIPRLVEDE